MEFQCAVGCDTIDAVKELDVEKDDQQSKQFINSNTEENPVDPEIFESGDQSNSVDNTLLSQDENVVAAGETIESQSDDLVADEADSHKVDDVHRMKLNDTPEFDNKLPLSHGTVQDVPEDLSSYSDQLNINTVSGAQKICCESPEGAGNGQPQDITIEPRLPDGSLTVELCTNEVYSEPEKAIIEVHTPDVVSKVEYVAEAIDLNISPRLQSPPAFPSEAKQEVIEAASPSSLADSQIEHVVQTSPSKSQSPTDNKVLDGSVDSSRDGSVSTENQSTQPMDNSAPPEKSLDESVEDNRQVLEQIDLNEPNDRSESASMLSVPDSMDESFDQQAVQYDDSDEDILPGARRPRHGNSDDEEDDDDDADDDVSVDYNSEYEDEDLVDSEHTSDALSCYGDAEDSQPNGSVRNELCDKDRVSSPHEEGSPVSEKPDNSAEHFEPSSSPSASKEVTLDADQDKSNPAYIPRTGRYFMHDYREAEDEELQESVNEVKSKKDTKRWQHDRFRYREQAPRSREELIRKYGYDIRSEGISKEASCVTSEATAPKADKPPDNLNRPDEEAVVVDESETLHQHRSDTRNQPGFFTRGSGGNRGRARGAYQPTQPPSYSSLRGRFTVGQRRSFYSAQPRRSETSNFSQINRDDAEENSGQYTQSGYVARRGNNPDPVRRTSERPEYKNTEPHYVSGRRPRHDTNPDNPPSMTVQQNRPSYTRPFTRSRGTIPGDNTEFSARRSAQTITHSKRPGSNQIGGNVAPRARDDHKPSDQGPKRYSTLRQTTDYQPASMTDDNRSRSHTVSAYQASPHTSRTYNPGIVDDIRTYSSKRTSYTPIADGFMKPVTMNRTEPTYTSMHNQSLSDAHASFPQLNYPNLPQTAPAAPDIYPMPNSHHFPEQVPLHPYAYQQSVDAYQFAPSDHTGGTYHQYSSYEIPERRPVLGRRPLKPLEIKDPRERCPPNTGEARERKGGLSHESWSKPTPELVSRNT